MERLSFVLLVVDDWVWAALSVADCHYGFGDAWARGLQATFSDSGLCDHGHFDSFGGDRADPRPDDLHYSWGADYRAL